MTEKGVILRMAVSYMLSNIDDLRECFEHPTLGMVEIDGKVYPAPVESEVEELLEEIKKHGPGFLDTKDTVIANLEEQIKKFQDEARYYYFKIFHENASRAMAAILSGHTPNEMVTMTEGEMRTTAKKAFEMATMMQDESPWSDLTEDNKWLNS